MPRKRGAVSKHYQPARDFVRLRLTEDPTLTAAQVDEQLREEASARARAGEKFEIPASFKTIEDWTELLRPAVQMAPWQIDQKDPDAARAVLPVVAWMAENGRVLRQSVGDWVAVLVAANPSLGEPEHREFLCRLALGFDIAPTVHPPDDPAALALFVACEPWLDGGRRYARAQARIDPGATGVLPYVVHLTSPAL